MIALLALALLAPPALPEAGPWTVDAVVAAAAAHNPRLAAARHRQTAAARAADAAAPWPEPRLMLQGSPLPVETRNGPMWGMASITQPFPWGDTLDGMRDAAAAEHRAAGEDIRLVTLAVEAEARRAFHRLHLARAEARINAEILDINRRLLRVTEERVAVDRAAIADVMQAQVELARLETAALDLDARARTRAAELNALLARDVLAPVPPLRDPDPRPVERLDALLADARARHPLLARKDAGLDAARARLRAAEARGRPTLSAGLGYTLIGEPEMAMPGSDPGRDAVTVTVGVELPIWGGARYDAERAAAAAAVDAAAAERAAAADVQAARVVEQAVAVEVALRAVRLYRDTALPLAEQTLATLEGAYAAGEADFDRVLAAERARERYAVEAARAAAAFELRLAALAEAVGRDITAAPTETEEVKP
ncbi:MAG: TolC family protein [bacterium]